MKRAEVYRIIDTERAYQIKGEETNHPHIVSGLHTGDTLLAIRHNLNMADIAWYNNKHPHIATMEYVRKIAALCVKLMEENGAVAREF